MGLQSVFDVLKIKRTELVGQAKNAIAAYLANPPHEDDELPPDTDETQPVDWWQHYGFLSRPPADAETLIARVGDNVFALASRALSAAKAFGQLAVGDVALYSLGGALLKLAATGSATLLIPTKSGKQTVAHVSSEDGSIKIVVPPGLAIEISPKNGVIVNVGDNDITFSGNRIQFLGKQFNAHCGFVKLGIAPTGAVVCGTLQPSPSVWA